MSLQCPSLILNTEVFGSRMYIFALMSYNRDRNRYNTFLCFFWIKIYKENSKNGLYCCTHWTENDKIHQCAVDTQTLTTYQNKIRQKTKVSHHKKALDKSPRACKCWKNSKLVFLPSQFLSNRSVPSPKPNRQRAFTKLIGVAKAYPSFHRKSSYPT